MARHADPEIIVRREVYTHGFPSIGGTAPPGSGGKGPGSVRR